MGKSVSKVEYEQARAKLLACKVGTCPNAGAKLDSEGTAYCGSCKSANKVRREYERTH